MSSLCLNFVQILKADRPVLKLGHFMSAMTSEPLLTPAEMNRADAAAIASGIPSLKLMRRAGQHVAETAGRMVQPGARIVVLAGPGKNGGDGFAAARLLAEAGYDVVVVLAGERFNLTGDAALMAAEWPGPVVAVSQVSFLGASLIVDALWGAGLSRDIEGEPYALIEAANASGCPILAVDLPSGIDGETGAVRSIAIHATRTITFAARKPGHLLEPGKSHCGPVEVGDIGIPIAILDGLRLKTFANGPDLWRETFPRPGQSSHKYDRGHTLVLSGGAIRTGAARLAARSALRIGSGLVTLASPPEALGVNATHLTAVMLRGCEGAEGLRTILEDRRFNALVLGPALGVHAATRALVTVAVQAHRRLVLDADALTSFEGLVEELHQAFRSSPTVVTPHDGEFARLFKGRGDSRSAFQARKGPARCHPSRIRRRSERRRYGDRCPRRPGGDQ